MFSRAKKLINRLSPDHPPSAAESRQGEAEGSDDLGLYDDILSGWYQNATDEVFRGVPVGPRDTVVDVGFGGGGSSLFCAKRGAQVIAIDQDLSASAALQLKLEKLEKLATRCHAVTVGDAHQLPIADNVATRVICTEVLEHVNDPDEVLAELARIGKPGALYLLSVPGDVQENLQKHIAPPIYFQKPNHVRIFSEQQFANLVMRHGLCIEQQVQHGFYHSIWLALFWACEVDITRPDHPALHHWTEAWRAILGTRSGPELKQQLDTFLPRTQIIVARKA
jgi:ubiquinone/menaquinone biosynthesis C-methylase UbiE